MPDGEEEVKVTLSIQDRLEVLEGSKTITLLLLAYTFLHLPRWLTLLLEIVLRSGFGLYPNGLLILSCTSMSTFMRCSITSTVLWWRIISIRNIMEEP